MTILIELLQAKTEKKGTKGAFQKTHFVENILIFKICFYYYINTHKIVNMNGNILQRYFTQNNF